MKKVGLEIEDVKPPVEKLSYRGLKLMNDKVYDGGTSIMYWM